MIENQAEDDWRIQWHEIERTSYPKQDDGETEASYQQRLNRWFGFDDGEDQYDLRVGLLYDKRRCNERQIAEMLGCSQQKVSNVLKGGMCVVWHRCEILLRVLMETENADPLAISRLTGIPAMLVIKAWEKGQPLCEAEKIERSSGKG